MGNYKKQEVNTLQRLNSQEKLLFCQVICRFKAFAYPSIINSNPSVNSCGEITISNFPTVAFSDIFLLGKLIFYNFQGKFCRNSSLLYFRSRNRYQCD